MKEFSEAPSESLVDTLSERVEALAKAQRSQDELLETAQTLFETYGVRTITVKLRTQMASSLQSRLQYNLTPLDEKGYIDRQPATGRQRLTIDLSQQGRVNYPTLLAHG